VRNPSFLLLLVLLYVGGVEGRILKYTATYYDLKWPNGTVTSGRVFGTTSTSDSIRLTVTPDIGLKLPSGAYYIWGSSAKGINANSCFRYGRTSCISGAADLTQYENRFCNDPQGIIRGSSLTNVRYSITGQIPSQLFCRYSTSGVYTCRTQWATDPATMNLGYFNAASGSGSSYTSNCMSVGSDEVTGALTINVNTSGPSDTCSYGTRAECNLCSWPYMSAPDSLGCGCKVDRSKLQARQLLVARTGLYCATYSDGTGRQFYYDESRSNFDPEKGPIKGACSAPPASTVYVPAGTCPAGTRLETVPDSGQSSEGTYAFEDVGVSGGGSDTGTHSRLDSILGQFKDLREYLDTVGQGGDTGILSAERDSALNGLDTAMAGASALQGVVDAHASRGDTAGFNGWTLDSVLDISVQWNGTVHRMSQESSYPILLASVRWLLRAVLFIWGLLMFWMFLMLAKGD